MKANFPTTSYEITIGKNLLRQVFHMASSYTDTFLITDETTYTLYQDKIEAFCRREKIIIIPEGEEQKSRKVKEEIENMLLEKGAGRDALLIALGGGVILDLVGFVAATFVRGIAFISVPTTLLAMVDAAIGGKTAVNTPWGKNLIGAIYHPKAIFIDLTFLSTLSNALLQQGLAEIIKKALIADRSFFDYLQANIDLWKKRDLCFLQTIIQRSIKIKLSIVEKDEKESSLRELLNLGHTLGHALEKATSYKLTHGQAVTLGLLGEGYIAFHLNYLARSTLDALITLCRDYALIPSFPFFSHNDFIQALYRDKKRKRGKVHCVLLQDIGTPYMKGKKYSFPIEQSTIDEALYFMKMLC